MSALVLLDAEVIAGPLRLTTTSNETSLEVEADELDVTTFGTEGWRAKQAGLRSGTVDSSGFWDSTPPEAGALSPDARLWSQLGGASVPVIIAPTSDDLSVAYIVPSIRGTISMLGKVGDVAPYASKMMGTGPVARGALLHSPASVESAGGTGPTFILGTVAEGRSVYASIHALALDGTAPQLTVTVERDDNAGFTSATTVATLGPVGAAASELTVVAGPVTPDDRYRVTWTLTGTSPTARFAVALGVT